MKTSLSFSIPFALAAALAGCGGGEEETQLSTTTTGVFRDAPVYGLWYQSTTGNGYTGSKGTFPYRPGETYTFFVGQMKLGSFTPTVDNATVTPASLVPAGTSSRETRIINLTRFLLTLDKDEDPDNGIEVDSDMDEAGLKWPQLDFTSLGSVSALNILEGKDGSYPGIQDVNGDTRSYVSVSAAEDHLSDSMSCAFSGAFFGARMSGSAVDSRVALVVDGAGVVTARQFYPTGSSVYNYSSPTAFEYLNLLDDETVQTDVSSASSSAVKLRYRHALAETDKVYINTTQTTAFSGSNQAIERVGGKPTAIRRVSGIISSAASPANDYVYVIEIDRDNVVSGKIVDIHTGNSAALTGSYVTSPSISLTGNATLDSRTLVLSGAFATAGNNWTASLAETANSVTTNQAFTGKGCKLNN